MASQCAETSSRRSLSLGRRSFASWTVKSLGKAGCTPWGFLFLAADGEAIGEHLREAGRPDLGLRLRDVVLDEAVDDAPLVRQHVRGERVAVARLAHGAWVYQVGPARAEVERVPPVHRAIRRGGHGFHV